MGTGRIGLVGTVTSLRADAFAIPYSDPVFGGPTDPVIVEDTVSGGWLLFYTQRRASQDLEDIEWVHGTRIGKARSTDGGRAWTYEGTVSDLEKHPEGRRQHTQWAPDIVRVDDRWLLFLTVVHGVNTTWTGRATIEQFESRDLVGWTWTGRVPLSSPRVIDAAVARTDDGLYRMWFKDESRGSTTFAAVSDRPGDPASWRETGEVIPGRSHEGPKVFRLGAWWWMVVDEWRGLAVNRSPDGVSGWQRQEAENGLILDSVPEIGHSTRTAHHADVVPLEADGVGDERALIVFFTHPAGRKSHVRSAVLRVDDGTLRCDPMDASF